MNTKGIALVTGANKGIGFETVRQLAGQGITVLLGARDEKRGAEAANKLKAEGLDVQFLQIDERFGVAGQCREVYPGQVRQVGYSDQQRRHCAGFSGSRFARHA